jgi:hypothetical protein
MRQRFSHVLPLGDRHKDSQLIQSHDDLASKVNGMTACARSFGAKFGS